MTTLPELLPGNLYPALLRTTESALACGALQCIETDQRIVADDGVDFLLRSVSSLRRKARDKQDRGPARGPDFNPFLPPEPELTLGAVSPSHTAVLNKFNVLDHHLLIVTRHFEHQESLLNQADFHALWLALREIDGLGFYNGGAEAGASQRHKHLQLVPLPLTDNQPGVPMESLFDAGAKPGASRQLDRLPFRHAHVTLPKGLRQDPDQAAKLTHELYRSMLRDCGIPAIRSDADDRQPAPYNLLIRRDWMLVVPRVREHFDNISINALGYAGSLFVRNQEEIQQVQACGPMRLLREVGLPR